MGPNQIILNTIKAYILDLFPANTTLNLTSSCSLRLSAAYFYRAEDVLIIIMD